jgi:regulator of protease activity HflC (stomatin/prohibitin superfamily)
MAQENKRSFARGWKEFWGKRKVMPPIPFPETSILTQPDTFRVDTPGCFLPLPPITAAIVTSSTGQKQVFTEGGYKELPEGAYTIQYVDMSERLFNLPRIAASTIDGNEVSFTVSISYKVNDPSLVIQVATPLQVLFSVCEAAIKNFIISHHHDELIGEPGNGQIIADYKIIEFIKEQIALNQACRAFWVMDVIIKERFGNMEISRLKHDRSVQRNRNITQQEYLMQQQEIAEERKKLEIKNADIDRQILEIRALGKAEQSEILERAERLSIELDYLRNLPSMQHKEKLEVISAFDKIVQALIQAQIASGIPRDTNQMKLIENFISSFTDIQRITPQIPNESSKRVDELGTTIINLMTKKK